MDAGRESSGGSDGDQWGGHGWTKPWELTQKDLEDSRRGGPLALWHGTCSVGTWWAGWLWVIIELQTIALRQG